MAGEAGPLRKTKGSGDDRYESRWEGDIDVNRIDGPAGFRGIPVRAALPSPGSGSDVMAELSRALRCRANVLLTGNAAAGIRYFRSAYPKEDRRTLDGEHMNRMDPGAVRALLRGRPAVLFLSRVDRLERWAQLFLLDLVEKQPDPESAAQPAIHRVISTSTVNLSRLALSGGFSSPLYLRLSTLSIHIGSSGRDLSGDPLLHGERTWRILGTPETAPPPPLSGMGRSASVPPIHEARRDGNGRE